MSEVNFDSMSLPELFKFQAEHNLTIPTLSELLTVDVLHQRANQIPVEEMVAVPTGRSSFTTYSKEFEVEFRDAVKSVYLQPESRQAFEALRQRIVKMSFAELIEFNRYRNLVKSTTRDHLYDLESHRAFNGTPQTESYQQGGVTLAFTEQFVSDFREAAIAAVDQKEKDFVNEHSC